MKARLLFLLALLLAPLLGTLVSATASVAQDRGDQSNTPAVDPLMDSSIPLTPAMVEELQHRFDTGQRLRAGVDDPATVAMPMSRSVSVALGPGGVTNIVQIVQGYPSAISFLDATGQPWPIAWDVNSNPGGNCSKDGGGSSSAAIQAQGIIACVPDKGSNVLQISPSGRYARGGLLVTLKGAPKPIAFLVIAGPGRYDADMTVRVSERGPNAKAQSASLSDAPLTGTPLLTAMLDGTPPAEAIPLEVAGVSPDELRAWKLGNDIYLRTRLALVSPEATADESEYGITVYQMPATPIVLLSINDRTISARLSEP